MIASNSSDDHSYNLEKAEVIYKAYIDIHVYAEEGERTHAAFLDAEEKLKQAGKILFEPTINGEIQIPASNGGEATTLLAIVSVKDGRGRVQVQ